MGHCLVHRGHVPFGEGMWVAWILCTWRYYWSLWDLSGAKRHKTYLFMVLLFSVVIGPLQLIVTWYKTRHVGTQETHWDKTNKENYHFK